MLKILEGKLVNKNYSVAIVVSRFNDFITSRLLEGSLDCLKRHDFEEGNITVVKCPGSFEIPMTAKMLCNTKKYDAVICLGALIRGETPHFDFIAAEVTKGIAQVSLETGIPVSFGVITADNAEQAIDRAGTKSGNKGWEAALTAIEMLDLKSKISKPSK